MNTIGGSFIMRLSPIHRLTHPPWLRRWRDGWWSGLLGRAATESEWWDKTALQQAAPGYTDACAPRLTPTLGYSWPADVQEKLDWLLLRGLEAEGAAVGSGGKQSDHFWVRADLSATPTPAPSGFRMRVPYTGTPIPSALLYGGPLQVALRQAAAGEALDSHNAIVLLRAAGDGVALGLEQRPLLMPAFQGPGPLYMERKDMRRRRPAECDRWRNSGGKWGRVVEAVPPELAGGIRGLSLARRRGYVSRGGGLPEHKYLHFSFEGSTGGRSVDGSQMMLYQVLPVAAGR